MTWLLTNSLASWLLPPGCLILTGGFGLWRLWRQHRTSGYSLIIFTLVSLWLLSTPWVSHRLAQQIEPPALDLKHLPKAQAIVILGGGKYHAPPEYPETDSVNRPTLSRLRYGAKLYHQTHLPILVTGGNPEGGTLSEAQVMKACLEEDFHTPVTWTENRSTTTQSNASESFSVLKTHGVSRIFLVTQAWHMPRATRAFTRAGFTVIPAPIDFSTHSPTPLLDWMPHAGNLMLSSLVAHELIGELWYQLKFSLHF